MESYPRSPESSHEPGNKKPEKDSSNKYSKEKKRIGGAIAERVVTRPPEIEAPKDQESLWQRIAAYAEKREIDKSILKPIEHADGDSKLDVKKSSVPSDEAGASKSETASEDIEAIDDAHLESLSREETHETVQRFAEARKQALREELTELPDGTPPPVESAADLAFLDYVEQQLAENPERPVEELLNEAEAATAERIQSEHMDAESSGGESEETTAQSPVEGEIPLHGASGDEDEAPIIIGSSTPPSTATGSGGGGGNVPPTPPTPGGSAGTPTGSGGGGVSPSYPSPTPPTGMPSPGLPPQPGYASTAPAGYASGNYNTAPAITERELLTERRRAMVQGFLVGGILGYFIGRRRGRIKTEKRLLPIQKKLENEVKSLAETVALKEQAIQKQAAESAAKLKSLEKRQRFAESLIPPAAAFAAAGAESGRVYTEAPVVFGAQQERKRLSAMPRAERLGRILVESPSDVDFSKKVEDYTPGELNQAAEKIRIDGVTLREIRNTHQLDERAVRRIITKFVEGGSVREALNKELFDKELKYERDPKYRQAGAGRGGVSGGSAASTAAAAMIDMASGETSRNNTAQSSKASSSSSSKKPVPDQKTLNKVRKQQIAELSVAGVIIVGIIVALVVLLK